MKFSMRTQFWIALLTILLVSVSLRFWRLDQIPASLTGDELAFSYNGYSLWQTGKDEFGVPWPTTFKSFGDFKVPLPVYLQMPFVGIFGLNAWSIRLPMTIISSLAPVIVFLITWQLLQLRTFIQNFSFELQNKGLNKLNTKSELALNLGQAQSVLIISFAAGLLLAVSPWHIHYSRGGWESSLAVSLTAIGLWLLLLGLKHLRYSVIAVLFFAAAMYAYHASRVYVPLLFGGWLLIKHWSGLQHIVLTKKWSLIWKDATLKNDVLMGLLFGLLALPAILSLTNLTGNARFVSSSVGVFWDRPFLIQFLGDRQLDMTIFQQFLPKVYLFLSDVASKILAYFSPAQIFVFGDVVGRHSLSDMGRLLVADLLLWSLAIWYVMKSPLTKLKLWLLYWVLIGALPAVITQDEYHTIRSLMMTLPMSILCGLGIREVWLTLPKRWLQTIVVVGGGTYLFLFVTYFVNYHYISASETAETFQYGLKESLALVKENYSDYEQIIIDPPVLYGHPYIHVLTHLSIDPAYYQQHANRADNTSVIPPVTEVYGFGNFIFRGIYWPEDRALHNTVFIGTPLGLPINDVLGTENARVLGEVQYPTGETALYVVELE